MPGIFRRKLGAHSNILSGPAAGFIVINGAMFVWACGQFCGAGITSRGATPVTRIIG